MDGDPDDCNETVNDEVSLLDLPEPVLIQIFSYLDLNFLRHVAPKVSVAFRYMSRQQTLWSNAVLSFESKDAWDDNSSEEFIRELKVTPYLRHLTVSCLEDMHDVESALAATRCKIHELSLQVVNYNPNWLLMLKRHPEVKKLELADNADDHEISASVAYIIGKMVPNLISLNLSHSCLLYMPVTGRLLSAASHQGAIPLNKTADWWPSDQACHIPSGTETFDIAVDVDVDNRLELEDRGDKPTSTRGRGRGLEHLKYLMFEGTLLDNNDGDDGGEAGAIVARNLAVLIEGNCHSLLDVQVDMPRQEVYQALGKCTRLKNLTVKCDGRAEGLCAMLEAMAETSMRTLQSLRLVTPPWLQPKHLDEVLRTLSRLKARVEALDLVGAAASHPSTPLTFPGFSGLSGLLTGGRGRSEPPCLRVLRVDDMAPVGRQEMLELAQLARASPSLRLLELSDCVCSRERSFHECRDRADEVLQALPELQLVTSNRWLGHDDNYDMGFMPLHTCDCQRRTPEWRPRNTNRPRTKQSYGSVPKP